MRRVREILVCRWLLPSWVVRSLPSSQPLNSTTRPLKLPGMLFRILESALTVTLRSVKRQSRHGSSTGRFMRNISVK